jgi:hypothetical protein
MYGGLCVGEKSKSEHARTKCEIHIKSRLLKNENANHHTGVIEMTTNNEENSGNCE